MNLNDIKIDDKNKFAICTLKVVQENLGKTNPVYFSSKDCTKRKLILSSMYNDINLTKKCSYIYAKDIESINFFNYIDYDLLIIDDIEKIEKHKNWQENLRHIINEMTNNKKQIILSGTKEIEDLNINDNLKALMQSGFVIRIFD